MSVIGIDLGNLNTVIAVARNRGVDIICNESSNRATPTLIGFGPKNRLLGEAAKTLEISNLKNTVSCIKRLIGRSFSDIEEEKKFVSCELIALQNGQVGANVSYLGEAKTFSCVELLAMYFSKVKDIVFKETGVAPTDIVMSCPLYFLESQKRAIINAIEIAGMNCLRLIHDTTAAAIQYGITKFDLPDDKPKHVCIVDVGHTSYQVAVVAFTKTGLQVKGVGFNSNFGGRNLDEALADHFAEVFKEKYKINIKSNAKAMTRLRAACEKVKKILSANSNTSLNVESIMDDKDVSAMITRSELEEFIKPEIEKLNEPLVQALQASGLTADQIDSVEVVGGCTRVPIVKEKLSEFFKKEISFTLNQDEAIAKGCALQCAIISPVFKVRDYSIQDIATFPIKLMWEPLPHDPEDKEVMLISKYSTFPTTKLLTFHRKETFDVEAFYAEESTNALQPWLGRFTVKLESADFVSVKVKAKMNIHGLLSFESAHIVKEEKVETPKEEKAEKAVEEDKTESSEKTDKTEKTEEETPKVKKVKVDVPLIGGNSSLNQKALIDLRDSELQMVAADKLVYDTEEKKNALEAYIYEMRDKVDSVYSEFGTVSEKESFNAELNKMEDWLYDEGEDVTKGVYVEKLNYLKKFGDVLVSRYNEFEARENGLRILKEKIDFYSAFVNSTDEKYSHIPLEEKAKLSNECKQIAQFIEEGLAKQNTLKKSDAPALTAAAIKAKTEGLIAIGAAVMSIKKPEVKVPEKAEENKENEESNLKEEAAEGKIEEVAMDVDSPKETVDMQVD